MKCTRSYLRLVFRFAMAFVLVFSIMFGLCVEVVKAEDVEYSNKFDLDSFNWDMYYNSGNTTGQTITVVNDLLQSEHIIDLSQYNLSFFDSSTYSLTLTYSATAVTYNLKTLSRVNPVLQYSFDGINYTNCGSLAYTTSNRTITVNIPIVEGCDTLYLRGYATAKIAGLSGDVGVNRDKYVFSNVSLVEKYTLPAGQIVIADKYLENVYQNMASSNVSSAYENVLNKTYDDVLMTRKFMLGTEWADYSGTVTTGQIMGSTIDSSTITGSSVNSGNYSTDNIVLNATGSSSISMGPSTSNITLEENGGRTNVVVDVSFATTYDFGMTLDATRLYFFDFDYRDVNVYKNLPDNQDAYYTACESYILVQGQRYECGDLWSTDFIKHTTNASSLQYVVNLTFVVVVENGFDEWLYNSAFLELGILLDNPTIKIYDMGKYDKTDEVIDQIGQGNASQEQGNELQKEQNETTNNIFGSITDFFGSFFENLIGIFVPEDGYFEEFFVRLNTFFSDKLGMLYSPIELFINLLTGIQNASAVDAGIPFPGLKWEDMYIIEPQTISLSDIAKDFPGLQEKIYFVTDVIMVGAVVMLLQNKLKEILTT